MSQQFAEQNRPDHWRGLDGSVDRTPSVDPHITSVLVCGNQPLYRSALASLIERGSRFRVAAECGNDIASMQEALKERIDVVLIDFDLRSDRPERLEAIETVLDLAAPRPTLIVSGTFDAEACQTVLGHGISGIVLKSSGGDVLLSAIESALRGQVWLDRALLTQMFDDTQSRRTERAEQSKIEQLTAREREIVQVTCTGLSNKQIAQKLAISEATVRHHLGSIFSKLGVSSRSELLVYSYRNKLTQPFSGR